MIILQTLIKNADTILLNQKMFNFLFSMKYNILYIYIMSRYNVVNHRLLI